MNRLDKTIHLSDTAVSYLVVSYFSQQLIVEWLQTALHKRVIFKLGWTWQCRARGWTSNGCEMPSSVSWEYFIPMTAWLAPETLNGNITQGTSWLDSFDGTDLRLLFPSTTKWRANPSTLSSGMSEYAKDMKHTGVGDFYCMRLWRHIPWTYCIVELTAGSMKANRCCMHGTEPAI